MLVSMSFEDPSNDVLLFNTIFKDKCASHILHSAVERLSVLELKVNSNLAFKFESPSHYSKVGIVAFNDADCGNGEFKETHCKALFHCSIILVGPVTFFTFSFITS